MIFISSITSKEKAVDYNKMIICPRCEAYGQVNLSYTYTSLSLFFIPVFKWNKEYYVNMGCCHGIFSLGKDLGEKIEKKKSVEIWAEDLIDLNIEMQVKTCSSCGKQVAYEYNYCPHCGRRI